MFPRPSNWRTSALAFLSGILTFAALATVGAALIYMLSTRGRIDSPGSLSQFINPTLVAGFVLLYVIPGLVVGRIAFVRPALHGAALGTVIGLLLVLFPLLEYLGFRASPSTVLGLRGTGMDFGASLFVLIIAATMCAFGGWLGGHFGTKKRGTP